MNVNSNNNNSNSSSHDEGNTALRGFLNELFLERVGVVSDDDDDCCGSDFCDSDSYSVIVSSNESSCDNNTNRRLRRKMLLITVAPDNARVLCTRSSPLGRMSVHAKQSAYAHNSYSKSLSNSVHSLNSSTSISNNSISNWGNSQGSQKQSPNHRDSRWSSSSINNNMHPHSLHKNSKIKKSITSDPLSTTSVIDSSVACVTALSADGDDVDVDDVNFFNDDNDKNSVSSVQSFAMSGNSDHNKNNAAPASSSRVAAAATTTGDMPRLPQRTRDYFYEQNQQSQKTIKTIVKRSLSDKSMTRPLYKPTKSTSLSPPTKNRFPKRGFSDPVGRWAAMITTKGAGGADSCATKCPPPPRRATSDIFDHESDSDNDDDDDDDDIIAIAAEVAASCSLYYADIKKMLPPTRRLTYPILPMSIPESLRTLPHHALHVDKDCYVSQQ